MPHAAAQLLLANVTKLTWKPTKRITTLMSREAVTQLRFCSPILCRKTVLTHERRQSPQQSR